MMHRMVSATNSGPQRIREVCQLTQGHRRGGTTCHITNVPQGTAHKAQITAQALATVKCSGNMQSMYPQPKMQTRSRASSPCKGPPARHQHLQYRHRRRFWESFLWAMVRTGIPLRHLALVSTSALRCSQMKPLMHARQSWAPLPIRPRMKSTETLRSWKLTRMQCLDV